jgi:hypothetical protein
MIRWFKRKKKEDREAPPEDTREKQTVDEEGPPEEQTPFEQTQVPAAELEPAPQDEAGPEMEPPHRPAGSR